MRWRWLAVVVVAAAAAACYAVAMQRHEKIDDIARPFVGGSGPLRDIDVFSPFTVGNAYLWLGLGVGLTVAVVALLAGARWRQLLFPWLTGLLIAGVLAGATYAQVERDSPRAALRSGIYVTLNDDPGAPDTETASPVFEPFNWRSPYLALGLAGGLFVGAGATALMRFLGSATARP